ncbi:MAG: AAA family ATPase [Acidimicrobiales bacterium]
MKPALIYLYGPPASGKLTIAERLSKLTGYPLFHNHLTVNAISSVFTFGSDPYKDVLHRLRLDVFETAARAGIGLIFTNNSAWSGPNARARFVAFAAEAKQVVEAQQGRILFVQLSAPLAVLEERLTNESRRAHQKLLDVHRLRELILTLDDSPLHPNDLIIDTSVLSAEAATRTIVKVLE